MTTNDDKLPTVRPLTEGMVRKGGTNAFPSQITERPPPPAPINVPKMNSGEEGVERKPDLVELLRACVSAFNQIPNRSFRHDGVFTDTYELAAKIDKALKRV